MGKCKFVRRFLELGVITVNAIALKMTSLNVPGFHSVFFLGRVDELLCEFYQLLDAS